MGRPGGRHAFRRTPRTRVNFQIRVPEVRVINADGDQMGVMPIEEAIALAAEKELDLVEVSPTARPPVCRIVDYGKFKYEKSKKERESKKKQHTIQVKEIKLRPKIEEHDYQFKRKHAEEFLGKANRIKFTVIFRGRELDHRELGRRVLDRMIKDLENIGTVERVPMFEGRLMTMYMAPVITKPPPKKKASKKSAAAKKEATEASKETAAKKAPVTATETATEKTPEAATEKAPVPETATEKTLEAVPEKAPVPETATEKTPEAATEKTAEASADNQGVVAGAALDTPPVDPPPAEPISKETEESAET